MNPPTRRRFLLSRPSAPPRRTIGADRRPSWEEPGPSAAAPCISLFPCSRPSTIEAATAASVRVPFPADAAVAGTGAGTFAGVRVASDSGVSFSALFILQGQTLPNCRPDAGLSASLSRSDAEPRPLLDFSNKPFASVSRGLPGRLSFETRLGFRRLLAAVAS